MATKNSKDNSIGYAVISVYDKQGVVPFAKDLVASGYQIISTGGTAKTLTENSIPVIPIQEITGNPESFDGRMKTISFQIESGILFDRSNKQHQDEAKKLHIKPIDIVVCNLYPFEKIIAKAETTEKKAIEHIDVGGPTMIRAAAKNFQHVLVVVDPNDYQTVTTYLQSKKDDNSIRFRKSLAAKAFAHISIYDTVIARFFSDQQFPNEITLPGRKVMDLRYGENPHQHAAMYMQPNTNSPLQQVKKWWGRELSLVNITDINAGLESVRMFKEPAAVVIKHNSPCGVALGDSAKQALERAIEADPESAFGGVIVLNTPIDMQAASLVAQFKNQTKGNFDILAAPSVDTETVTYLSKLRKSMGIYTFGTIPKQSNDPCNLKWIDGGFIVQTPDIQIEKQFAKWEVVTKNKPTKQQLTQMKIAWKFISRIRSNAVIVLDKTIPMTRGIGSGQTSRVRSTKIALEQAGEFAKGAVLASDSFFPFDDSVKLAAKAGIATIVQQGGSINDQAVIAAANNAGIAMVFTHHRAFWH